MLKTVLKYRARGKKRNGGEGRDEAGAGGEAGSASFRAENRQIHGLQATEEVPTGRNEQLRGVALLQSRRAGLRHDRKEGRLQKKAGGDVRETRRLSTDTPRERPKDAGKRPAHRTGLNWTERSMGAVKSLQASSSRVSAV